MGVFATIKGYLSVAAGLIGSAFLAWVWWLKNANEKKAEMIEDLEHEATIKEKVVERGLDVAKFEGTMEELDRELEEKRKTTKDKVKEVQHEVNNDDYNDYVRI